MSCSTLNGTLFLQCWNMVPLIEVHFFFFLNHGTIFIKLQELFHALQNESFLDCDISLIKTC